MAKIGFLTERMLLGFGVDMVIDRVAAGLTGYGHDVTVYPSLTDGTYDGAPYAIKPVPTPAYSVFPRYDYSARRWLEFLNNENVDVWLVSTFPFFSLIPKLTAPAIAVDYGVCSTEGFPLHMKANFAYMKWTQQHMYFKKARKIITISEFVKSQLPKALHANTEVIYVGVDHYINDWIARGEPAAESRKFRQDHGVSDEDILLTYVGRLNPEGQPYKGVNDLMNAYDIIRAEEPRAKMVMVGFGDDKDKEMIANRGIIPVIKAPPELMPVIYDATDIYMTASKWEGFDMPAAEAESFGEPVVMLKIGAHSEIAVDNDTAFIVETASELPDAALTLCRNEQLRRKMGMAAKQYVDRFKWAKIVEDYEHSISEVVAR